MKLSDELVLVEKPDGDWFLRSMRKDHINPKLRSPAYLQTLERGKTASKGARGYGFYKGRRMLNASIALARANGMPATQPHHSYKEERRAILREKFERSGIVLVTWFGRVVSFFTPTQIRFYERQAIEREQRKRDRELEIIAE